MEIQCINCKKLYLKQEMKRDPKLCNRCWELDRLQEYAAMHVITVVNPILVSVNEDEGFKFNLNNNPRRR